MKSIDNLFAKIGSYPWRGDSDMADFDALVEAVQDEIREGYIELPMDADGVPIRVDDKVVDWDTPRLVVAVSEDSICLAGYESDSYYRIGIAKNYRHYTPDTWERIIEDAVNVHGNGFNPCWTDERDALVARCKALAGDE